MKLVVLYCLIIAQSNLRADYNPIPNPDPTRLQDEINQYIKWDRKNSSPKNAVLFVGSSSIKMWQTSQAFPEHPVINRGFGGSHISDIIFYYDIVIKKYKPSIIIFYAGDNDIASRKSVSQVFEDYKEITKKILKDNPIVKFIYIPIKPSIKRWMYWGNMEAVNRIVKHYNKQNNNLLYIDLATPIFNSKGKPDNHLFLQDKLHLNKKGYKLWESILKSILNEIFQQNAIGKRSSR
ncbi:MAG: GDSL-type esterase/lipase family protein [Spirochaetota bacterium]|nr:GDSL-type esterase/lipase family protein [Spirochaetota bacterium]